MGQIVSKSKFATAVEGLKAKKLTLVSHEIQISEGGAFTLIPATFHPHLEDTFTLSIYSDNFSLALTRYG